MKKIKIFADKHPIFRWSDCVQTTQSTALSIPNIVKHSLHVWAGAGDTGTLDRYSGRILDSDNVDTEAGGNR